MGEDKDEDKRDLFDCTFVEGVKCPYKTCKKSKLLPQCANCKTYNKWMREMEAEEDKFFDEVDRIRATGQWL